eukprot:4732225-Pyramimonas_sp.AAC.1
MPEAAATNLFRQVDAKLAGRMLEAMGPERAGPILNNMAEKNQALALGLVEKMPKRVAGGLVSNCAVEAAKILLSKLPNIKDSAGKKNKHGCYA